MEHSSFAIAAEVSEQFALACFEPAIPMRHPYEWPPALTGVGSKDVHILALARIKLILDLDAQIPDLPPAEMRQFAYKRFLTIYPQAVPSEKAELYARVFIEAGVYDDGNMFWDNWAESDKPFLPGLTSYGSEDNQRDPDIIEFAKTLVRADLLERMERLRHEYQRDVPKET